MNLDHDIFTKKIQSIELATKVEEFLKANSLDKPVEIPFGQSSFKKESWNGGMQNAQSTMRNIMSSSINATKNKPSAEIKIKRKSRQSANRDARILAVENKQSTFTGECELHSFTIFGMKNDGKKHYCKACAKVNTQKYETKKKDLA